MAQAIVFSSKRSLHPWEKKLHYLPVEYFGGPSLNNNVEVSQRRYRGFNTTNEIWGNWFLPKGTC